MIELRPAKYLLGRLVPMDNNDKIPLFNLGSGTYDNTKFLRGDGTWAVPSGGGGSYVPYTGATGNVNLGEYGLLAGWIQIDTSPTTYTPGVGKLGWNDQDGTLEFQLLGGNVTLQIGQEQVARVVNKTDPLIDLLEANYQVVKITGAQGNRLKVALAQANNDANSAETLGVVTENILGNQEGFITTSGLVKSINTTGSLQGETWLDGDMLYLSGTIAGQMTKVKPSAPIHTVILGYVVRAHATQGQIYVKVDNGYELGELHDVNTTISKTTPIDADSVLLQDTADNNLWKKLSWSNLKATLKTYFDVLYQNKLTLTTAGTSGAATLVGDTLNIPQYSGGGGSSTVKKVALITTYGTLIESTTTNSISGSVLIPANTIPTNCLIDLSWMTNRPVAGATTTTCRVYVNTSNSLTGATLLATGQITSASITGRHIRQLSINGSTWAIATATAILTSDLSYSAAALTTFTLATNQDLYLIFAMQNANTTAKSQLSFASFISYE